MAIILEVFGISETVPHCDVHIMENEQHAIEEAKRLIAEHKDIKTTKVFNGPRLVYKN
jgi:hypothetical protein